MGIFNFNKQPTKEIEMSLIDIFQFATLEIPKITESKGSKYVIYGKDNLYPQWLRSLRNQSAIHNSIIQVRSYMMAGSNFLVNGAKTKEESDANLAALPLNDQIRYNAFIKNELGKKDLYEIKTNLSLDYQTQGQMALEVVWSTDFSYIATIKVVDSKDIRTGPLVNGKIEEFYYSRDWKYERNPTCIKAFNPKSPEIFKNSSEENPSNLTYNQLIWITDGDGDYYGEPFYIGSLTWIDIDAKMANFHLSNIENGFSPSMSLKFYQKPKTEEERISITNRIQKQFGGTSKAGKAMIFFSDGKENAPDIDAIQVANLDKQYLALSELATRNILIGAQASSPLLFGNSTPGSLGGNTELETAYRIYNNAVIAPSRMKLEKIFNELLKINKIPVTITIEAFNPIL